MNLKWNNVVKDVKTFFTKEVVPTLHDAVDRIKGLFSKAEAEVSATPTPTPTPTSAPTMKFIPVVEITPTPEEKAREMEKLKVEKDDVTEEVSPTATPILEALDVNNDGEVVEITLAGANE